MVSKKSGLVIAITTLVIAYYWNDYNQVREGILIETKSGPVKGIVSTSRDGNDFYEWLSIPFAKSPVGKLRFASPEPIEPWTKVLDATAYGARCAQVMLVTGYPMGEEDCLFLNVHVPKVEFDKKKLLPVIINLYAGAFVFGASHDYPPDYFMDEPVVYTSMNYRLGALGFASTGDTSIRGNMGLKDQAMAIKWISENIESFGGDPTKITLLGLSAGGASVHFMTLSEVTRGLFQKAIAQSGNALLPWAFSSPEKIMRQTKSFAKSLDCPTETSEELTKCLQSKPISQILVASQKDAIATRLYDPSSDGEMFTPTIEAVNDEEAFLTRGPYDVMMEGAAHRIPMLLGVTKDEALTMAFGFYRNNNKILYNIEENWMQTIGRDFELWGLSKKKSDLQELLQKVRTFYFPPDLAKNWTVEERISKYTEMMSDMLFFVGTSEAGRIHSKFAPVYFYYLTRYMRMPFGHMGVEMGARFNPAIESFFYIVKATFRYYLGDIIGHVHRVYGVGHGTDAPFYFPLFNGFVTIPKIEHDNPAFYTQKDYKFSKDLVKLLVNFATDENRMEFRGIKFQPIEKDKELTYLRLNEESEMIQEPFAQRRKFWQSLNYAEAFSSNSSKKWVNVRV